MAKYRKINEDQVGEHKATVQVVRDEDGTIIGRIVGQIIDENGPGWQRGDLPMIEAFDPLEEFVGKSGIVDVLDPDNLWDKDWPTLEDA